MPQRVLRTVLLLGVVLATALVASGGDEPQRPAWLVGRWETTTNEGTLHLAFEPDGTMSLGGAPTVGAQWSDAGGRWEVRDGALVVGDPTKGEATVAFRIERPADEDGHLRLRLVEPGNEAVAPFYRKALGRPRWLIGTWTTQSVTGRERWILRADGQARQVTEIGSEVEHVDRGRWAEREGKLQIGPSSGPPFEIELLPPEDGRLRARFRRARLPDPQRIWTRASWLPPQTYEGPLLGRWDVLDAALPTAWLFGPYGRYERRRAFAAGTLVERGTFREVRSATGGTLHLESDAGHRRTVDLRQEGPILRFTNATRGISVDAKRVEGSPVAVAAAAIEEAAARADLEATYRFLHDERHRVGTSAPPPAPPAAPPTPDTPTVPHVGSNADPAPHDVFAGMEAFRRLQRFRFESEQVLVRDASSGRGVLGETKEALARAVAGSARPRVVLVLAFQPNGRVAESTDTWELNSTGDAITVTRHGKYGLQGDVVVVQFEGGPEARWRLGEAGRYLYRGDATLMAVLAWEDMVAAT